MGLNKRLKINIFIMKISDKYLVFLLAFIRLTHTIYNFENNFITFGATNPP